MDALPPARRTPAVSGLAPLLRAALLLAGLVAALLLLREASPASLRAIPPTPAGGALFALAASPLLAVGVPRWAAPLAAGYVFGAWAGGLLSLLPQLAAAALDFAWARFVARDALRRRFARRLARLDRALSAHPFTTVLTLRLLPVGNSVLLSLLAGATGVRLLPFLAGSAIGFLPQTAIFALAGSGVAIDRTHQLALAAVLFTAAAALGLYLLRRTRAAQLS